MKTAYLQKRKCDEKVRLNDTIRACVWCVVHVFMYVCVCVCVCGDKIKTMNSSTPCEHTPHTHTHTHTHTLILTKVYKRQGLVVPWQCHHALVHRVEKVEEPKRRWFRWPGRCTRHGFSVLCTVVILTIALLRVDRSPSFSNSLVGRYRVGFWLCCIWFVVTSAMNAIDGCRCGLGIARSSRRTCDGERTQHDVNTYSCA